MARGTYRRWTAEEEKYLQEHYPSEEDAAIAKATNRTASSVVMKAFKLGLRKSKPFISAKKSKAKRRTYESERRRLIFGLPQKTKHVVRIPGDAKLQCRMRLRYRYGYICPPDEPNAAYYDEKTRRSAKAEKFATKKYYIEFVPIKDCSR